MFLPVGPYIKEFFRKRFFERSIIRTSRFESMLTNPTGSDTLNLARLSPQKELQPRKGLFFCFGWLVG